MKLVLIFTNFQDILNHLMGFNLMLEGYKGKDEIVLKGSLGTPV